MSAKKTPATPEPSVKSKKLSLQGGLLTLLILAVVFQFFQISHLEKKLVELSPGAEDSGGLSDFFGGEEESEEDELGTLLFDFVNNLGVYEENKARYEANLAALQTAVQDAYWNGKGLSLSNPQGTYTEQDLDYIFLDASVGNVPLLTLSLAYDGKVEVHVYGSEFELSDGQSVDSSIVEVKAHLDTDLDTLRSTVQKVNAQRTALSIFILGQDFQTLVMEKSLKVLPEADQLGSYVIVFQNSEATPIAECEVLKKNAQLVCSTQAPAEELSGASVAEVQEDLLALFTAMDARTALQKKVDEQKAKIAEVLEDPAFKASLKNAGLSVGSATETETAIQYPIVNAGGAVLRLLILDKSTGEVKVSLSDGQDTQGLVTAVQLLEFSSKKKLWTSPVSSRTMLSSLMTLTI
ncbi:hypothetical protein IPG41_03200 [Candidatus Peregrinibacteria bacterium]|nr:MAG: hypothetical protein IPG41_03200 [Candidatus Peregrinibacteria bacterium]